MTQHYLNVSYSIDEANGHYSLRVKPGENPGDTEVIQVDMGKEVACVGCDLKQLELLIEALQRRLVDAKREDREAFGTVELTEEERRMARGGNKIGAIKSVRDRLRARGIDCSLKQAKDAVDLVA